MFDIGFQELVLIAALALIVLGPKRLPEAARTAGLWVGRLRAFITSVKQDLDREMEGGGLEELKRLREELNETRRVIEQTSGKTIEQLRSLDHAILDDASMTFADENKPASASKKKAPVRKKSVDAGAAPGAKTGKESTAKKSTRKKIARNKPRVPRS